MSDYQSSPLPNFYSCPECSDDVPVEEGEHIVFCPCCEERLLVDPEAEFRDGMWHDLTKLRRYEPYKEACEP